MLSWHMVWDSCICSLHRCSLYNLLVITSGSHLYIRRHVNLLWETFRTACYFGHEVLSPRLADFCEVFCFLFSDGYIGLFWLNHEIDDGGYSTIAYTGTQYLKYREKVKNIFEIRKHRRILTPRRPRALSSGKISKDASFRSWTLCKEGNLSLIRISSIVLISSFTVSYFSSPTWTQITTSVILQGDEMLLSCLAAYWNMLVV